MRSPRTTLLAALAAALAVLPAAAAHHDADQMIGLAAVDPDRAYGPAGADEWFARQRLWPDPSVDIAGKLTRARNQAAAMRTGHERAGALAAAPAWQPLGPGNGGRVSDVVVDPTRADTVYAGAASGGVWKSTDGGTTFSYSWGPTLPQAIGALAIAPNGTLYAGTGEGNPGSASYSFPGNGVYRSTDGGATWTHTGLSGTDRIGRVAIDPANSNRLFVAAAGTLYQPGGARGLYRSEDGGATWTQVLAGANSTTGAIDVALGSGGTVFAAMWDHTRTPAGRQYGGTGSGIHKSTDGGATWTRVGGGLPASSSNLGRMGVAVAKSDPNRVYVIAADTPGNFSGFWTSTNGGASWTAASSTTALRNSQSSYGWWFGRIVVDPAASQHIWVAGVPMLESTNAGGSWTQNGSSFHVDQHSVAVDPRVSGRVFIGNDGGVYRSTQNGSLSGGWTKARGLSNMQFYSVGVSQQDVSRINGGLQDNGSVRSWAGWAEYYGGDGLANVIDPTNHNKVYACSQNGSCGRSTTGGNSMSSFGSTSSERYNWFAPVVLDPTTPSTVYFAGNRVNRSTNSAQTFTVISPNLTVTTWGTVTAIVVAKSNAAVIYAGTDDGKLWVTRNTGGSWTDISAGLPTRYITRVTVDPTDANLAYVAVSGYRNGSSAAQVFRTTNGGSTYTAISGNLPDAPVNDLILDPQNRGTLYVGTDVGAFSSTNGGANWSPLGTGLPLVPVSDLEPAVVSGQTVLTAATYGLGMYQIRLESGVSNDFSVAVSPGNASVAAGSSATATVSTAVVSGSAESVALSATGLPSGATATFTPSSVTAGGQSTMSITTSASTPAGTYPVAITGASPSATRSTTFTLTVTGGTTCTGTNGNDVAIPDQSTVTSTVTISGCTGNASTTSTAEVHIRHTYIGDLVVSLVAPDGTAYTLHNRTGSGTDNIDQTYTLNLSTEPRNGTWTLRVQDAAAQDIGTIDTWTLTL